MSAISEQSFRDAYVIYDRNHAEQRDALMAALSHVELANPRRKHRRLLAALSALAAMLMVACGIAALMTSHATPAYGVEDLRARLRVLHSLYVKGWMYQRTKTEFGVATVRFPVERYYERPTTYYGVVYGFSSRGNDDLQRVTKVTVADDGKRSWVIADSEKQAISTPTFDTLQAELRVESGLQASEAQQLLNGLPGNFARIGSEQLRGASCDIYESKPEAGDNMLLRVWVDPSSGLPRRILGVERSKDGDEQPIYEYTEIKADTKPPAGLFSFNIPKDYNFKEVNETPTNSSIGSYSSGSCADHHAASWVGIKIDEDAVLLCWSEWTDENDKQLWFHDAPKFILQSSGTERDCSEESLYETKSGELTWRWSLIRPKDHQSVGTAAFTIKITDPKDGTMTLSDLPLAFEGDRLNDMVDRVQRRSLEETGNFASVKSVAELRKIIESKPISK